LSNDIVSALQRIGLPAVFPLLESLASPDRVRQEIAFRALTGIGADAVPALLRVFPTTKNPQVRQQIIRLLGMAGDPRAVEPLATILERGATGTFSPRGLVRSVFDPTVEERRLAADALGNLALPKCGKPLLLAAQYDLEQEVREHAARALAGLGDAEKVLELAKPQVAGEVSRAFLSVLVLLVVGFVIGAFDRLIGDGNAGLLAGLGAAGWVGAVDGLTGQKRIVRGTLIGVGMVALWGAFDALFLGSPPVETLLTLAPVRIGAIFFGVLGFVGSAFRNNPLLGVYRIRFVPRGCLSLGWPVIGGGIGLLVGGVSGAVLMLQAGNPTFFSWAGGIALGVLLVISWLQRGNRMELQRGLLLALGLFGLVIVTLAFALSIPEPVIPWLLPLFPAIGAATGFQAQPLRRRIYGFLGGMIAGIVGAGFGVWGMGMVK
jgi:hypothetical protein